MSVIHLNGKVGTSLMISRDDASRILSLFKDEATIVVSLSLHTDSNATSDLMIIGWGWKACSSCFMYLISCNIPLRVTETKRSDSLSLKRSPFSRNGSKIGIGDLISPPLIFFQTWSSSFVRQHDS